MEEFLQVPDYYNIEDTSGKKHVSTKNIKSQLINHLVKRATISKYAGYDKVGSKNLQ